MKNVTMQDIADRLKVSKVTVSKVFQGNPDISKAMAKKVYQVADELGYIYPKKAAVNVSVLISELFFTKDEDFYTGLYRSLFQVSTAKNINLSLVIVKRTANNEYEIYHDFSNQQAIIILGQLPKKSVIEIMKMNLPTICVDFCYRNLNLDAVVSDNYYASFNITSYLIDQGHKNIGFIGTLNSTLSINDRFLGYYKALLESGITIDSKNLIDDRNHHGEKSSFDLPKPLPTAFVCNNDHVAYLLIQQLKKQKLSVPKDISVVGFDNVKYSTLSDPQITTMKVSRTAVAEQTIDILFKRLKQPNMKRNIISIECTLIERESVLKLV
ncbi:MAG: LacI family DNA-binding transcriptional regulator [Bacilli bacterium]|nr:LacI family DNA-binding transcriptional regulator [Bacilli bacterium]